MRSLRAGFLSGVVLGLVLATSCRRQDEGFDSEVKAQDFARRIFGEAPPYRPIAADAEQLATSMKARRAHAWAVADEVLRPVAVSVAERAGGAELRQAQVPMFFTWYDRDEFAAMWRELHARLTPAQRRKLRSIDPADRFAIDPALVDQVVKDHARVSVGMGEERFQRVLRRLEGGRDVAGAGQSGVSERGMVVFSPQLVTHYLENAAWVYHCGRAYEPAPAPDSFGSCFGKPFPEGAVAVKATFNPRASGVAAFDTSAAGLERLMTATGPDAERWRQRSDPAGRAMVVRLDDDASLAKIHSIKLRDQDFLVGEYVLTGLHVTTKETAEWIWATLWWSNEPDTDFGADRPAAFGSGDPAWKNYKMCVATTWDEKDPVVTGDAAPQGLPVDLMQALRAAHAYAQPYTWCSNPFIEGMPRGANSNCIGCHQHAGPRGMPPASQGPDRGRKASAFPGDFLASFLRAGEGFQPELRSVVDDFPEGD